MCGNEFLNLAFLFLLLWPRNYHGAAILWSQECRLTGWLLSWSMTSNQYSPWKHVLYIYADFMADYMESPVTISPLRSVLSLEWQGYSDRKVWRWWQSRDVCLYIMLAVYQLSTHLYFKKMHILIILIIYIYRTLSITETCVYLAVAGTLVSIFCVVLWTQWGLTR